VIHRFGHLNSSRRPRLRVGDPPDICISASHKELVGGISLGQFVGNDADYTVAAVYDRRNSWIQPSIRLCAPSFGSRHGEAMV